MVVFLGGNCQLWIAAFTKANRSLVSFPLVQGLGYNPSTSLVWPVF